MGAHRRQTHYLIDGYNLAHAIRRGPIPAGELESARASLVRLLRRLPDRATAVTVVFDSRLEKAHSKPRGMTGVVEVVFASDADAAIVETVRRSGAPSSYVVVSRDREVSGRAAQLGARTLSIDALLERIGGSGDAGPDPGEPPEKYGAEP